jgi:prolipoprotein diacylglyceryltransferase
MYAVLRFIVEIYRDQPYGYTQIGPLMLSRGQILTIPVFALGLGLFTFIQFRKKERI